MQRIEITVPKGGKATVEAFGFSGGACIEATKNIENAIGPVDGDREMKADFKDLQTTVETVEATVEPQN